MYKKPENADDLSRAIAELEVKAAVQKKEIEQHLQSFLKI